MKASHVLCAWIALAALGCGSSSSPTRPPGALGPTPRVWHDLGLTRSQSQVWALARHGGALYAGGVIHDALGQSQLGVARWDGSSWSAPPLPSGVVESLASYNGELIAGGTFDTNDGDPGDSHILRWDGTSWKELGSGVSGPVLAMIPFGDDLIVAGSFVQPGSNIARWDGSVWHPLGAGLNNPVQALAAYEGKLIAGGTFWASGSMVRSRIAQWDGNTWATLGYGCDAPVLALTVHEGRLYAGGAFENAGGKHSNGVAVWNGAEWNPVGQGLRREPQDVVHALTVWNGSVVAAGKFGENVARWNGSQWVAMPGLPATVYDLAPFGERLVAGGIFHNVNGAPNAVAGWIE